MKATINKIHSLKSSDLDLLLNKTKRVKFKKGELLLFEGQVCKGIYFIETGIIGLYQVYKDRLIYQDFFFETDFATNISSLSSGQPSNNYLVAIEDVEALFITKQMLLQLYEVSPDFKEFGRKLLEQLLVDKTNISFVQSSLTAKEKYDFVLEKLPHLIQRIPLQYLSSYLGMTRETLSRMRKNR